MRRLAMLGLVAGCYRQEIAPPATPAPTPARVARGSVPDLTCSQPSPSGLRDVEPRLGGYRLLETDEQLEAARRAMQSGVGVTPASSHQRVPALWDALDDLRPQLQYCLVEADGTHPELQYQIRLSVTGNSVASLIEGVELRRITGVNRDNSPILAPTQAEACVQQVLTHVELPPGDSIGSSMTIFRQDFCTPSVEMALRDTRVLVDEYLGWWRTHAAQTCPRSLAELDGPAMDPWHQPYVMRCNASGFQVLSAGPDRKLGTADDLESHR